MTTKKIPISFNETDQANIKQLIDLLGISNTYGDVPKAIKFGISLALSVIKNPEKVYTNLNDSELDLFFLSVKRFEIMQRAEQKAKSIIENAQKV